MIISKMKKFLTICGLVITTLPVFAQWFTNSNDDIQANLGSSKVLVGVLPGTLPGRINIAAPSSMPHISLFGGPLVSASNLLNRFNLNIGTTASLGMITNDNSGACGLGMLNGPNLASPVIWMYNSGSGNNAFTVSRVNYDPVGISNLENNFVTLFQVRENGNVGIGTTNPTQRLTVKGTVYSTEVKVDLAAGTGPDYVFEPTYALPSLDSIQSYINQNKHLPEVPSAREMEANGVNLGEMNMLLLKKVEELTLYMIEQNKGIVEQKEINRELIDSIVELKKQMTDKKTKK